MKAQLTFKDYENYSAYLDGQLSTAETRRLEARLQADPEARAALEEMSVTRQLLRSAPHFRAPRNFTLTPEMARQNARRSFFPALPVFRFSAALAALALIAVFMLELNGYLLPSPSQTVALVAPEAAPAQKAAGTQAGESAPRMVLQWDAGSYIPPAFGLGGGMGGGGGGSGQPGDPSANPYTNPLTGPVSLPLSAAEDLAPSTTPEASSEQARLTAAESQSANPILGLPSQADGGKIISPNGDLQDLPDAPVVQAQPPVSTQPEPAWLNPRRQIELGLVLLAAAAVLGALFSRRKAA